MRVRGGGLRYVVGAATRPLLAPLPTRTYLTPAFPLLCPLDGLSVRSGGISGRSLGGANRGVRESTDVHPGIRGVHMALQTISPDRSLPQREGGRKANRGWGSWAARDERLSEGREAGASRRVKAGSPGGPTSPSTQASSTAITGSLLPPQPRLRAREDFPSSSQGAAGTERERPCVVVVA